jgi:hypothetical protein
MICQLSPTVGPIGEEQCQCLYGHKSYHKPMSYVLCLALTCCMVWIGRTLTTITFPILVTVNLIPNIKANYSPQYGTYNGSLGTVSIEAVCCSLSHIMGCWVTWEGIVTNAHTLAASPAGACQYPTILWYDTVDKNMQLQMNWYCVSC